MTISAAAPTTLDNSLLISRVRKLGEATLAVAERMPILAQTSLSRDDLHTRTARIDKGRSEGGQINRVLRRHKSLSLSRFQNEIRKLWITLAAKAAHHAAAADHRMENTSGHTRV